jgi:hypothetical protein
MFGFFVGWGVFWLLIWLVALVWGLLGRSDGLTGCGALGIAFSVIYLIAVVVGKLVTFI